MTTEYAGRNCNLWLFRTLKQIWRSTRIKLRLNRYLCRANMFHPFFRRPVVNYRAAKEKVDISAIGFKLSLISIYFGSSLDCRVDTVQQTSASKERRDGQENWEKWNKFTGKEGWWCFSVVQMRFIQPIHLAIHAPRPSSHQRLSCFSFLHCFYSTETDKNRQPKINTRLVTNKPKQALTRGRTGHFSYHFNRP